MRIYACLLGIAVVLVEVGCSYDTNPKKARGLTCENANGCPAGYHCVLTDGGSRGLCCSDQSSSSCLGNESPDGSVLTSGSMDVSATVEAASSLSDGSAGRWEGGLRFPFDMLSESSSAETAGLSGDARLPIEVRPPAEDGPGAGLAHDAGDASGWSAVLDARFLPESAVEAPGSTVDYCAGRTNLLASLQPQWQVGSRRALPYAYGSQIASVPEGKIIFELYSSLPSEPLWMCLTYDIEAGPLSWESAIVHNGGDWEDLWRKRGLESRTGSHLDCFDVSLLTNQVKAIQIAALVLWSTGPLVRLTSASLCSQSSASGSTTDAGAAGTASLPTAMDAPTTSGSGSAGPSHGPARSRDAGVDSPLSPEPPDGGLVLEEVLNDTARDAGAESVFDDQSPGKRCQGKANLLAGLAPQWQVASGTASAYAFGSKVTSEPEGKILFSKNGELPQDALWFCLDYEVSGESISWDSAIIHNAPSWEDRWRQVDLRSAAGRHQDCFSIPASEQQLSPVQIVAFVIWNSGSELQLNEATLCRQEEGGDSGTVVDAAPASPDSWSYDGSASGNRCLGKGNLLLDRNPLWQVASGPLSAYVFGTKVTGEPEGKILFLLDSGLPQSPLWFCLDYQVTGGPMSWDSAIVHNGPPWEDRWRQAGLQSTEGRHQDCFSVPASDQTFSSVQIAAFVLWNSGIEVQVNEITLCPQDGDVAVPANADGAPPLDALTPDAPVIEDPSWLCAGRPNLLDELTPGWQAGSMPISPYTWGEVVSVSPGDSVLFQVPGSLPTSALWFCLDFQVQDLAASVDSAIFQNAPPWSSRWRMSGQTLPVGPGRQCFDIPASSEAFSPMQVVPFVFWNSGPRFALNSAELCLQE